jgi:hypothetical protein
MIVRATQENPSFSEMPEDVSGQAGWMFSDMLIALMVVFLATITFIPQFNASSNSAVIKGGNKGSVQGGVSGNYTYTEHFSPVFIRAYKTNEAKYVGADILAFEKQHSLPLDSVIDSAQFVGGYGDSGSSADALHSAIAFSQSLEMISPKILEHASSILNSSRNLANNLVTVRFTFGATVSTN